MDSCREESGYVRPVMLLCILSALVPKGLQSLIESPYTTAVKGKWRYDYAES